VRESLLGTTLAETGWFDRRYLQRIVNEHGAGVRDHNSLIWSLLMFERALKRARGERPLPEIGRDGGAPVLREISAQ